MARTKTDPGKRDRILTSAMKVFARKGFASARVSDVAREAGVADGTIYLYFASKDAILIAIIEEGMQRVIEGLVKGLKAIDDPKERLRFFVKYHLRTVEDDPDLGEVLLVELRFSDKFLTEYKPGAMLEKYLEHLVAIISEGQRRGVFKREIPTGIALGAVFGALDEISLHRVLARRRRSEPSFNIDAVAESLSSMLISGLSA
ncbi:MAG TPA: TetR/AcrR family transcriptional regulator [bacterium]|nr:TetR/AcrR family transcriptional regulator [bacterium]